MLDNTVLLHPSLHDPSPAGPHAPSFSMLCYVWASATFSFWYALKRRCPPPGAEQSSVGPPLVSVPAGLRACVCIKEREGGLPPKISLDQCRDHQSQGPAIQVGISIFLPPRAGFRA